MFEKKYTNQKLETVRKEISHWIDLPTDGVHCTISSELWRYILQYTYWFRRWKHTVCPPLCHPHQTIHVLLIVKHRASHMMLLFCARLIFGVVIFSRCIFIFGKAVSSNCAWRTGSRISVSTDKGSHIVNIADVTSQKKNRNIDIVRRFTYS